MTRLEKWESYRREIDQSSMIGQSINDQAAKIEKYHREIDKINPAILQNVAPANLNLQKGVSEVIVSQKRVPAQITKMFKDLNKARPISNKNTISTILFNLKNNNILGDNKKVKEDWLSTNSDYASLSAFIKTANLDLSKDKELEKDLQTKFESLSNVKADAQVLTINALNKNGQKNIGHHVFIISVAIALVFFLLILVLLFVRWFA